MTRSLGSLDPIDGTCSKCWYRGEDYRNGRSAPEPNGVCEAQGSLLLLLFCLTTTCVKQNSHFPHPFGDRHRWKSKNAAIVGCLEPVGVLGLVVDVQLHTWKKSVCEHCITLRINIHHNNQSVRGVYWVPMGYQKSSQTNSPVFSHARVSLSLSLSPMCEVEERRVVYTVQKQSVDSHHVCMLDRRASAASVPQFGAFSEVVVVVSL